ncbi:hypothetical protein AAFC00_004322 [Neodothiora populina]|uniref:Major facilitator superfamily (MFS) profile domain-containing protein n=1 Tax=Neodothiora populina TaxID=2781224 RepID=A0ABR3PKG3_9PEZI
MNAIDTPPDTTPETHKKASATQNDRESFSLDLQSNPRDQEHCKTPEASAVKDSDDGDAPQRPHSAFTEGAKISTILMVSFIGLISPLSASVYYPALDSIATDLSVSITLVNLTITTYLIFQGLAPSLVANFSDIRGRRPAYLICFAVYLGANIGLALQSNYVALIILRCLQSSGSSGTVVLGSAVVADLSTRADRGKYLGYASLGIALGPAIGPILGGVLDRYLGWHSIFWFLVIFSGAMLLVMLIFLPETSRVVVGDGSLPPPKYSISLISYLQQRRQRRKGIPPRVDAMPKETPSGRSRRANPLATLSVAHDRAGFMILLYAGLHYAGYFAVLSTLSTELAARYGLDSLQVGLCFLPIGIGAMASRITVSIIIDRNFRRHARAAAAAAGEEELYESERQKRIDPKKIGDIERARLQVAIPAVYASCALVIAYAWTMDKRTPLAVPLVLLFFCGNVFAGVTTALNVLVVDLNRHRPATAVAAINLFRCLLGAGATAAAKPLIEAIGLGWTGVLIAGVWACASPVLWVVMFYGMIWRDRKGNEGEEGKTESQV